ncbi:hypothetical protein OROMI_023330 [Orobanche minor]
MGNCMKKESSTQWGGDELGSFGSDQKRDENFVPDMGENRRGSPTGARQVKIVVSKKKLKRVLEKAGVQGDSPEQILGQLTNDGDDLREAHQQQWRPELQSIPEVN